MRAVVRSRTMVLRAVVLRAVPMASAAALLCLLCTTACKKSAPQADASAITHGLKPEEAAQVLARVGDRTLTVGEYFAALEHMDPFDRMRYRSAERRKELLREMVDVMLLADEARSKGYDKDPITEQEIREILRDALLKKAHEGVPAPNEVPDEQVRVYYETHRADFRDPERRRVAAIVLASASAGATALDAARKASAVQWGDLVRAKSVDPKAKADVPADLAGDFGFVGPPGDARGDNPRVPDEVRAAVFEVKRIGEVLPRVVRSDNGKFYVVKLSAKTDPHERSLQEAERMIRVKLTQDKIQQKEQDLLADLRRQFPVTVDENALASVRVDAPSSDAGTAQ